MSDNPDFHTHTAIQLAYVVRSIIENDDHHYAFASIDINQEVSFDKSEPTENPEVFEIKLHDLSQLGRDVPLPSQMKILYNQDTDDEDGYSNVVIGTMDNVAVQFSSHMPAYCDDECDATGDFTFYVSNNPNELSKFIAQKTIGLVSENVSGICNNLLSLVGQTSPDIIAQVFLDQCVKNNPVFFDSMQRIILEKTNPSSKKKQKTKI